MPSTVRRRSQAGNGRGRGGHVLFQRCTVTPGASEIAAENILMSLLVDGKTLYRNRQTLRIRCYGSAAANGNNKKIKVYVNATAVLAAATAVYDSGTLTINDKNWSVDGRIFRTAADVQLAYFTGLSDATAIALQRTALTRDDDADFYVIVAGTAATGAADIVAEYLGIESLNDAP